MRRRVGPTIVMAMLVACSGGTAVLADDLPEIALRQEEAPAGTALSEERSGPQTVEDFGGNPELDQQGFRGAYAVLYETPEAPLPADRVFVANFLATFDDEEGASWSFDQFLERFASGTQHRELPTEGLGEEAFAAQGEPSEATRGRPWFAYSWRVGNLHVTLSIQGDVSEAEALEMARAIDERADSAAA